MARCDRPDRRDALRTLTAGAIGTAAAGTWVDVLSALAQIHAHTPAGAAVRQTADWKPQVLTPQQNAAVVVLTELIIPETDTPGAKGAGVNRFIDQVLHEAGAGERERFVRGLAWMDERSRSLFGSEFATAEPAQQNELLTRLADEDSRAEEDQTGVEFFRAIKSIAISGYYTTEIGLRQELGDDGRLAMTEFAGCEHPEHVGG